MAETRQQAHELYADLVADVLRRYEKSGRCVPLAPALKGGGTTVTSLGGEGDRKLTGCDVLAAGNSGGAIVASENVQHAANIGDYGAAQALHVLFAQLGRQDLFFMLTHLLGRTDMDRDWIFARCRDVQRAPDGHLDLWAREHYKSTIITFGQTIRDIMCDPEITVGIFSHSRPVAKDFLSQIRHEFEHNALLQACYPDVLWRHPRVEAPVWSLDKGIVVRRATNPKEATVEAWGLVDGQPTGKHFRLLVYDDVVTRESVSTPEMIAKVTDCWALSLNLGAHGGRRRYIGTRYHYNDTYRAIMDREAAVPRIHPATVCGNAEGEPVLLHKEALDEKRRAMGPYVFGCQMLLNPAADVAQGFREAWLRRYVAESRNDWAHCNRYLLVDPAGERRQGSDYTVMLVVALAPDGNYYVIDGIRDRLNLTGRAAALFRLHRAHRPLVVGYEKYGMQADIEHVRMEQARRNYRFDIIPLGGAMPKKDRIRRLVPLFEQGRMYLPDALRFMDTEGRSRDMMVEFVQDEYLAFPVSRHDDMLDCLARIVDPALGACFPSPDSEPPVPETVGNMEYDLYA